MASSKVASRYAKALLDLSIEQKSMDKVKADMVQLSGLCKESKELANMLKSPIIDKRKKVDILTAIFSGKVEKVSLGFMALMIKNSRADIVEQIADSFVDQYKKHNGILDVHVTSAIPLEKKVKDQILAKIQASFQGTIELHEKVDADLLGGFVVSIDDKQIDASIKTQLSNLKNILLN